MQSKACSLTNILRSANKMSCAQWSSISAHSLLHTQSDANEDCSGQMSVAGVGRIRNECTR